ncbi:type II secretion system ATPase GspE [Candidatus Babeliales bacterium]|nr:type II secretion system ATPase GspE [Candidatus Babeliales bacterium]
MDKKRKDIIDILLEEKLITKKLLDEILAEKEKTGTPLNQILLNKGIIKKEQLAKVLAKQMNLPYIEKITEKMADPTLLGKIPLKFLKQHAVIPIILDGRKVIVTSNPSDLQPLDELSILIKGTVGHAISTDDTIVDGINKYYPLEASKEMMEELPEEEGALDLGAIESKDILEMANEAPIVKLVNHILYQAVKEEASDIHIEPFEKELRVRYRIDGALYQKVLPPKRYQGAIVSRIKIMANLNIAEKRLPQDGRILIKIADKPIDIRVSILPSNYGERVVMRLLDKTKAVFELEKLNLSKENYKIINNIVTQPNGIILVTGPTGSGKTTTLYAILTKLNQPNVNIITVEDPVEYTIHGVSQVQINEKIGLSFAAALRSILRQDPDIVLIGEIRDQETAQIATQASLTGHLVLSTIHTNSAPATITRLIDMDVEPFLIASTVICIVAQRLVRNLCDKCKEKYSPAKDLIKRLGISLEEAKNISFYRGIGCEECLNTGYSGRSAIFEVMYITDELRKLIMQRSDASVIRQKAVEEGMKVLATDGLRFIKQGLTSVEEILAVAQVEETDLNITLDVEKV